ncbi:MAG: cupin domain-containing protein [Alphaproteobacteria bacterium]|nr:cupin domain-containing protein [Alphaproteobacteria bacterium]
MSDTAVVDFSAEPLGVTERRLSDLPERVIAGDPRHVTQTRFESPDGNVIAGTWTSTPGKWRAFTDRDEFCVILSGHARLIDEAGREQSFKTGDAFLIPNGFRGYWDVIETTTKHFVIRQHAPA